MVRIWWWVILMVVALAAPAVSAEDLKRSDPVVITATKVETRQSELGASVDVLADHLQTYNYDRIEEALRQVPGVEIRRSGSLGKTTSIQIRGFNGNRVQVKVDGMSVKSPTLGAADLSELSLDAIDRIEIVRGPQSTLHGADAMGGVVNIITKKGQGPPRGTLHVEGGSHGTFREMVSTSGAAGRFNFALSGSRHDSSGQFERTDDSDLTAVAGRIGVDLPGKAELWLSGRYAKVRTDLPVHSTNPTVFDPNSQQQTETYLYNLNYKQALLPWWEIALRYGQWWNNQGFQDPPPPGDLFTGDDIATNAFANPRSQIDTRRREFEMINVFHEAPWASLTIGAEHRNERGRNRSICSPLLPVFIVLVGDCERATFSFRQEINTISVFGQQDLKFFERVFLSGGLRWDDNDQFGDEVTPRVSAAVVIKETGTRLRGAWGKGFRAPTINDLIFPGFGAPAVGPERSESYEVGVDQALWERRVRFGTTYFHNEMRNLIQAVCNEFFTICVAANVGGARAQGLESYAQVDPLEWIGLYVNYTFTDTRNTTTGADLPQFARHVWNAGVEARPLERLRLFAQAHVQSSEFVSSFAGRKPGFHRIDVGGAFRLFGRRGHHESTDLTLRIENVTNERYEEVLGFRALGIHAMVGLRVALQ